MALGVLRGDDHVEQVAQRAAARPRPDRRRRGSWRSRSPSRRPSSRSSRRRVLHALVGQQQRACWRGSTPGRRRTAPRRGPATKTAICSISGRPTLATRRSSSQSSPSTVRTAWRCDSRMSATESITVPSRSSRIGSKPLTRSGGSVSTSSSAASSHAPRPASMLARSVRLKCSGVTEMAPSSIAAKSVPSSRRCDAHAAVDRVPAPAALLVEQGELVVVLAPAQARDLRARDRLRRQARRVDVEDDPLGEARRQHPRRERGGERRGGPEVVGAVVPLGRRPSSMVCAETAIAGMPSSVPSRAAATVPE